MRLILDQGLPRSTASLLRGLGHDVVHVGELGMAEASDEAIIAYAKAEGRCIVTLDADFHALLAIARASGPSVIRLRMQRLKAPDCVNWIKLVLARTGEELNTGCLITVTRSDIRARRLPITPRTA